MTVNTNNRHQRYTALETEVKILLRKRKEEATSAVQALSLITDEDVALLSREFPAIAEVRNYTVEMLLANEHGEIEKLRRLYDAMTAAFDRRLKYFEDALC